MNKCKTQLHDNIFIILSVILYIHLKLVTEIIEHFLVPMQDIFMSEIQI